MERENSVFLFYLFPPKIMKTNQVSFTSRSMLIDHKGSALSFIRGKAKKVQRQKQKKGVVYFEKERNNFLLFLSLSPFALSLSLFLYVPIAALPAVFLPTIKSASLSRSLVKGTSFAAL